jgi:RNA polymerase sigma-70 factor (ECF subfamily)
VLTHQESEESHRQVADLISRWKEGDRAAGDVLFRQFYPELMIYARRLFPHALRRRADTVDLVQETCAAACQSVENFEFRGRLSIYRWLCAILENRLWKRWNTERAQKRDIRRIRELIAEYQIDPTQDTPSECVALKEDVRRLNDAVRSLPPHYRRIVVARYLEARTWSEIASEFGKSKEAVQMLFQRALKKLHRELEE